MTHLMDELECSPYLKRRLRAELEVARERKARAKSHLLRVECADNTAAISGRYGKAMRAYHEACERVRELEYESDG